MPAVRYAAEQSRRRLLKPSAWPSPWAVARALSTGREHLQRSRVCSFGWNPGSADAGCGRLIHLHRIPLRRNQESASGGGRVGNRTAPRRRGPRPRPRLLVEPSQDGPASVWVRGDRLDHRHCDDAARRDVRRGRPRAPPRSASNHDPPRMQIHFDKALPLGGCEHSQCESVSSQGVHGRLRPAAQPIPEFALRAGAGPRRQGATRSRAFRHPHDAVAVVAARHQIAGTRQEHPGPRS